MEKKDAWELYKFMGSEQTSWLRLHRQASQQYFTLISVIFAALLGIFYKYIHDPISDAIFFGFLLNILLGLAGMRMCNRYYSRFLEAITIMAKIEPLIGLTNQRENKHDNNGWPFPKDKFYIPNRWREGRKDVQTSGKFIKDHRKAGANKYVQWTFISLIVANMIFGIIIIIRFFFRM